MGERRRTLRTITVLAALIFGAFVLQAVLHIDIEGWGPATVCVRGVAMETADAHPVTVTFRPLDGQGADHAVTITPGTSPDGEGEVRLKKGQWKVSLSHGDDGATPSAEESIEIDVAAGSHRTLCVYLQGDDTVLRIVPSDASDYPRSEPASVLEETPALPVIAADGAEVCLLDLTATDPYANSGDLLSASRLFTPWAIAHVRTERVEEACASPVIVVVGCLSNSSLDAAERTALVEHVRSGGVLVLFKPDDDALLATLGMSTLDPDTGERERPVAFDVSLDDPALTYVDHEAEIDWRCYFPTYARTQGYATTAPAEALGTWTTGGAAVVRARIGEGTAYVFGWRLRHVTLMAEQGLAYDWTSNATNAVSVDADLSRLLARGIVEGAVPNAKVRSLAPDGKQAALIITHDVDAYTSYDRVEEFLAWEEEYGVHATYLFTTSPYSNGWVAGFYDTADRDDIQAVIDAGGDVQSHSFGHFPDFDAVPLGTGEESAYDYVPLCMDRTTTAGMSVLGELGVSRWLLEEDFGIDVTGFRSGHLVRPAGMFEGLAMTGYRRDSSYGSPVVRGSLPFVAISEEDGTFVEYPIVVYPIAISDSGLETDTVTATVDAWEEVVRFNLDNGAPTVLLVHTSSQPGKLEALTELLARLEDVRSDLWIGDWTTFAEYWEDQGVTCDLGQ